MSTRSVDAVHEIWVVYAHERTVQLLEDEFPLRCCEHVLQGDVVCVVRRLRACGNAIEGAAHRHDMHAVQSEGLVGPVDELELDLAPRHVFETGVDGHVQAIDELNRRFPLRCDTAKTLRLTAYKQDEQDCYGAIR